MERRADGASTPSHRVVGGGGKGHALQTSAAWIRFGSEGGALDEEPRMPSEAFGCFGRLRTAIHSPKRVFRMKLRMPSEAFGCFGRPSIVRKGYFG